MSVLDAICDVIFSPRNSLENPSVGLSDALDAEWNGLGYSTASSSAGVQVTRERALGFHAFYRGCDLISSYVGKLPLHVYRKTKGGRETDTAHVNYRHLRYRPSVECNALQWKKTMELHRMMEGNGYTFCRRRGGGAVEEFVLLDPTRTWPVRANGSLYYMTTKQDGSYQLMNRMDVLHIKGMGFDGLVGYGLRHIGKQSLGSGIATIDYGGRYFRNGAIPAVVLEVPAGMDPKAKAELKNGWNQMHAGIDNAHKTAVLTGGAKATVISKNAQESQLTEQKKFTIIELANFLGLPPHKLGDSSRTAYNSLEQENQSFLDDSLDWRLVDWEQELYDKVLTEQQKQADTHEIGFDREQLVRADIAAMGNYLSQAIGGPWMTVDEGRTRQGMQERPGKEGDVLYGPSGSGVPSQPGEKPEPTEETPKPSPNAPSNLPRAVLLRSCVKMAERIARNAQRVAKKPNGFMDWIDAIQADHKNVMVEEFQPLVALVTPGSIADHTAGELADSIIDLASLELLDLSGSVTTAEALEGAVQEWSQRFTGAAMERVVQELFPTEV